MSLPGPQTLMALATLVTAVGTPLSLLFNFIIAMRQSKLRKSINGRMDNLIAATYDAGHTRGQLTALAQAVTPPPPYVIEAKGAKEAKENPPKS